MGKIRPTYGQYLAKPDPRGYLRQWCPTRKRIILQHHKIWLDSGRGLPQGMHLHHLDGNRQNNAIENLQLVSSIEHHTIHHQVGDLVRNQHGTSRVKPEKDRATQHKLNKLLTRACLGCKKEFNNKRVDAEYCCSNCRIKTWKRKTKSNT